MENVIVVILHMFFRVTDRLIAMLFEDLSVMDSSWTTNLNDNLNFCKYVTFLDSIGIKKAYRTENNNFILRKLNGVDKLKLFNKIDLCNLFPNLPRVNVKNKLWKDAGGIAATQKLTKDWYDLYVSLDFQNKTTPYIHIFGVHLYNQVNLFSSKGLFLNEFSIQGLGKPNDFLTQYYHLAINRKDSTYLNQLLKKRNRIEILTHHKDLVKLFENKKTECTERKYFNY